MGVAVKEEVDTGRRVGRGDVDEADAETGANEVEGEGPVADGVAIAADHFYRFAAGAELVKEPVATDVAEVPDLVGAGNALYELERQFVMRIRDDGDTGRFLGQVISERESVCLW
jgi:hypothetical protein